MVRGQVVIKRSVSIDRKTIAEAKSVATASDDRQSQISQTFSVNILSGNSSSSRMAQHLALVLTLIRLVERLFTNVTNGLYKQSVCEDF